MNIMVWNKAWELLKGLTDKSSTSNTAAFITVDEQNYPQARTVVVRAVDETEESLYFHTDRRSAKVKELENNPECGWLIYDQNSKTQLRLAVTAMIVDDEVLIEQQWRQLSPLNQQLYGIQPAPGTEVARQEISFDEQSSRQQFLVVKTIIHKIDYLVLGTELPHLRVRLIKENTEWSEHEIVS